MFIIMIKSMIWIVVKKDTEIRIATKRQEDFYFHKLSQQRQNPEWNTSAHSYASNLTILWSLLYMEVEVRLNVFRFSISYRILKPNKAAETNMLINYCMMSHSPTAWIELQ